MNDPGDKIAKWRDALPPVEVEHRAMDAARRLLTTPKSEKPAGRAPKGQPAAEGSAAPGRPKRHAKP